MKRQLSNPVFFLQKLVLEVVNCPFCGQENQIPAWGTPDPRVAWGAPKRRA